MACGFKGTGTIDHIGLYVGSDDEQYRVSVQARTSEGVEIEVSRSKAGGIQSTKISKTSKMHFAGLPIWNLKGKRSKAQY